MARNTARRIAAAKRAFQTSRRILHEQNLEPQLGSEEAASSRFVKLEEGVATEDIPQNGCSRIEKGVNKESSIVEVLERNGWSEMIFRH